MKKKFSILQSYYILEVLTLNDNMMRLVVQNKLVSSFLEIILGQTKSERDRGIKCNVKGKRFFCVWFGKRWPDTVRVQSTQNL